MGAKNLKQLASAVEEARKAHFDRVTIPKLYLCALQDAQVFEQQLHFMLLGFTQKMQTLAKSTNTYYKPKYNPQWTYRELKDRLETFLPKLENVEFYKAIEKADLARNKFIHECFKLENGLINLDLDKFYLRKAARSLLDKWLDSYSEANKEIIKIFKKHFLDMNIKIPSAS